MKRFQFKSEAVCRNNKYWISRDILRTKIITSNNLKDAISEFVKFANGDGFFSISKNAERKKESLYIDMLNGESKKIGYMFKALTEIEGKQVWCELWVTIDELTNPFE